MIPFKVKEKFKNHSLEQLMHSYSPDDKTSQGENLLTLYVNSRNKHNLCNELDILLNKNYVFQPNLVLATSLLFVYEEIFKEENKESFDQYHRVFASNKYPNKAYYALTLPIENRFNLFYSLYNENDNFPNILEKIFEDKKQMNFHSINDWDNFHQDVISVVDFLIKEKKLSLDDLNNLTDKKVENLYSNQIFSYYSRVYYNQRGVRGIADKLKILSASQIPEKNAQEQLNVIKSEVLKNYFEHKLEFKFFEPKHKKI